MELWHIVLISFGDDVAKETRDKVYNMYQTLDKDCGGKDAGILFWKVERSLDDRKKVHLVEVAVYRDNDALQKFRVHPNHKKLTDILGADPGTKWWVGDFNSPFET